MRNWHFLFRIVSSIQCLKFITYSQCSFLSHLPSNTQCVMSGLRWPHFLLFVFGMEILHLGWVIIGLLLQAWTVSMVFIKHLVLWIMWVMLIILINSFFLLESHRWLKVILHTGIYILGLITNECVWIFDQWTYILEKQISWW